VSTHPLAEAGIPIIEIMQLDELAADKVWTFAFFGTRIKLRGFDAHLGPHPSSAMRRR
jgi:hypothetical protein